MNSQDNQNHPGSQPVIPFTGLRAIQAAEQMKRQAKGGFTLKNLEPARPGAEAPTESFEALVEGLTMDAIALGCTKDYKTEVSLRADVDRGAALILSRFSSLVKALETALGKIPYGNEALVIKIETLLSQVKGGA